MAVFVWWCWVYIQLGDQPEVEWIEGFAIWVAVLVVIAVTATNDWAKEKQFRKLGRVKGQARCAMSSRSTESTRRHLRHSFSAPSTYLLHLLLLPAPALRRSLFFPQSEPLRVLPLSPLCALVSWSLPPRCRSLLSDVGACMYHLKVTKRRRQLRDLTLFQLHGLCNTYLHIYIGIPPP